MASQPSSSSETPSVAKPRLCSAFSNSMNQGISILQGAHQVAQKFSRTTLPRKSESLTGLPEASSRTKSGAILRASGFTYTLDAELPTNKSCTQLDWLTQAETQRCANARVVGNAMSGSPAATVPAASHPHLRLRLLVFSRCSRNRARPRDVSGCHSPSGRSAARRSSTHGSLVLSITLDVLLSERLFRTTEKSSDGCRLQV